MSQQEQVSLKDIINYEPEVYMTEEDLKLIRDTFKDNPRLINVIRKIFLPTITDPQLPIEEFGKDMWTVGADWNMMSNEQIKSLIVARQEAIKFIAGGFISLKQIANIKEESPYAKQLRQKKDSTK